MKITRIHTLLSIGDFEKTREYSEIESEIKEAILSIENPRGSSNFILYDGKQANGVKPIKDEFISCLDSLGWKNERICDSLIEPRKIDTSKKLRSGKYFGVEWETGNISSSHRALNRIALGIRDELLVGGALVLPSRSMYKYLTDRVGNFQEIEEYFPIWEDLSYAFKHRKQNAIIKVFEIEHDGVSKEVPRFIKGTDGRAKG